MTNETTLIDYAYPMMMVEKHLKKAHDAVLHKDYDAALEHMTQATVEARTTFISIKHMKEQENALRK